MSQPTRASSLSAVASLAALSPTTWPSWGGKMWCCLERKQLTSGTTWHAAGLIAQLRATANMTKLAKYSQELYGNLEGETGVATGFKRVGSITAALTEERREEIFRQAGMARAFGVDVEEISPKEVKERYEHLNIDGVTAGVYLPLDGQGDPANIALALAKGARQNGAKVIERTAVTGSTARGAASRRWSGRTARDRSHRLRYDRELWRHVGP